MTLPPHLIVFALYTEDMVNKIRRGGEGEGGKGEGNTGMGRMGVEIDEDDGEEKETKEGRSVKKPYSYITIDLKNLILSSNLAICSFISLP